MSGTARLDDLAQQLGAGARTALVRAHFGISAFGVNAVVIDEPGEMIGEHDEVGERSGKHEELYFVSAGHATFTVNGDEVDAPAGTFVFVRDPAAKRGAVAKEAGTTIVAVGGRPGKAFTTSPWERNAAALIHFGTGDYEQAVEAFEQLHAETPDDPTILYNLACAKSQTGKKQEALGHLKRAVELNPDFAEMAEKDSDLDAIRDDPEFASAISGQPGAGGSGS